MPHVEEGRLVVKSDELQPRFAVEMRDIDGNVVLIPVWCEAIGFTSGRPYMHVEHASVLVGRSVMIDMVTGDRISADENGYNPWDPEQSHPRHMNTMELT